MVGGARARDDGGMKIGTANVFAALDSLKKKKKKSSEATKNGSSKANQGPAKEPEQFWAPAPLKVSSWADVDDDDDYYATTAPPQSMFGQSQQQSESIHEDVLEEESESEDDGLDDGDDEAEEAEQEPAIPVGREPIVEKLPTSVANKDADRQLSKKELKKKEMAELDAVLKELGIASDSSNAAPEETNDKNQQEQNLNGDKKEAVPTPVESKNAKKKKMKKEKSIKEQPEQPDNVDTSKGTQDVGTKTEEDTSAIDVKEKMKKVATMKKKKSSKEVDGAAKAAASEAAARSAKLAAAKKKEKSHYNQQPVR